jgi:hypothetical protein
VALFPSETLLGSQHSATNLCRNAAPDAQGRARPTGGPPGITAPKYPCEVQISPAAGSGIFDYLQPKRTKKLKS